VAAEREDPETVRPLAGAGVEIDPPAAERSARGVVEDRSPTEEQGRAHGPREPEHLGVCEEAVEADESPHRRSEDPRRFPHGIGPELRIDERLHRSRHESKVGVPFPASAIRLDERAVLVETGDARVGDPDDDRLDPLRGERLHRLVDAPLSREGRDPVEQVLSVVHVKNGIATLSLRVGGRKEDEQTPRIAEVARFHLIENTEVAHDGVIPASSRFHVVPPARDPLRAHAAFLRRRV
jgi:hypothetical protein